MNKYSLLIYALFVMAGCGPREPRLPGPVKDTVDDPVDTAVFVAPAIINRPFNPDNNRLAAAIARIRSFRVVEMERRVDTSAERDKACDGWLLSKMQLEQVFDSCSPIDGVIWDLAYSDYPCEYKCKVLINSIAFNLYVNAGATMHASLADSTQYHADTSFIFGYSGGRYSNLFLSTEQQEE